MGGNKRPILDAFVDAISCRKVVRYKELSENAFFYVEANTSVHSALIQEGDTFRLYGYAEIQSEEQVSNPSSVIAKPGIAKDLERTISLLPTAPGSTKLNF